MAKATKSIIPQKPVITYTLELTEKEANFLLAVTQCIGGDPVTSRRRYAITITEALKNAGIPELVVDEYFKIPDIMNSNRSIWFHNEVR
jgi:hypothetical protein